MSNQQSCLPQLRFPEFKDAGVWEGKPFKEIAKFLSGGTPSKDVPEYWEGTIPWISASSMHSTKIEKSDSNITFLAVSDGARMVDKGTLLLLVRGSMLHKRIPIGITETTVSFNQDVKAIVLKGDVSERYLMSFLIASESKLLAAVTATGIGAGKLDTNDLNDLLIKFPSLPEQQKIAACLTSLDDLITTENQQLEALKTHKKGLMQSLFPAEGETVPKQRFPEFKDAGAWEERALGDICKFVRGPFGGALTKDIFVKNGYAVYEQSHAIYNNFDSFRYFITKEKYEELKRFAVKPNDIIMSCSGTMGRFAVIPVTPKEGVINQALLKLTVSESYDLGFIRLSFDLPENQEKMLSQSAGGAIKNVVGVSELKKINMFIPSLPEQQKIAACLSSLDDLISAQSQKIEALKRHKKGLMQQLFPNVVSKIEITDHFRDATKMVEQERH